MAMSCSFPLLAALSLCLIVAHHHEVHVQGFVVSKPGLPQRRFRRNSSSTGSDHETACNNPGVASLETVQGPFQPSQIAHVWGRQPILVRNAFDHETLLSNSIWPDWEDILGMATANHPSEDELFLGGEEEQVQVEEWKDETGEDFLMGEKDDEVEEEESVLSRLIRRLDPERLDSFALELGPFSHDYLQDLLLQQDSNNNAWTLLLNDVDRIHSNLNSWIDQVFGDSWLPRWRRDDAQISVAQTGGGIGPHVDNYDVFLIQTKGKRQWKVTLNHKLTVQEEMDHLVDGLEVRILDLPPKEEEFAEQKGTVVVVTMNPGDLLYLPPRVVHWGTALSNDCMTLSVGCRAPSASELVSRVAEQLSYSHVNAAVQRYTDVNLLLQQQQQQQKDSARTTLTTTHATATTTTTSITPQVKDKMRQLVREAVEEILDSEELFDEIVGCLVTEPKRPTTDSYGHESSDDLDVDMDELEQDIQAALTDGVGALRRAEGVSVATSVVVLNKDSDSLYRVFCAGQMFEWKVAENNQKAATASNAILSSLASGQPFSKVSLGESSSVVPPEALAVIADLMKMGYLYYGVEEDE